MANEKKPVDFDGLFDEKLAQYMREKAGQYTEKQWENLIPKLYRQFGDITIASIGTTPTKYFSECSDEELVTLLCRYIEEDVPVSDFLCRELEGRNCPPALVSLLEEGDERLLTLAVNLAGENPAAFGAYFSILERTEDAELKDAVVEQLKGNADAAKERALMLEILSRCKARDERIYDILLAEFRTSGEIPMHASYLAAYGDTRALPVLLEVIDREDINYLEYQELKFAIEALGGEYTRPRDFSNDPYFKEISEQSQMPPDFDPLKKTQVN